MDEPFQGAKAALDAIRDVLADLSFDEGVAVLNAALIARIMRAPDKDRYRSIASFAEVLMDRLAKDGDTTFPAPPDWSSGPR